MNQILRTLSKYAVCTRSRLPAIFVFSWATLIGILLASRGIPPSVPLLAALTISSCNAAVAYIFNDIMDFEIDRINKLDRPVARGKVSRKEATSLVLLLAALALTLSLSINLQTFLLCTIFLTLAFVYSTPNIYLKKRYLLKPTVPGIGGAISNLIGGAVIGKMPPSLLYAAAFFFVCAFTGNIVADLSDVKGDMQEETKTFVVVFGPSFTVKFGATVLLSFSAITLLIYPLLGLSVVTPVLVTASILLFSWAFFSLLKKWQDPKSRSATRRKFALAFIIGQLAIFLGVF